MLDPKIEQVARQIQNVLQGIKDLGDDIDKKTVQYFNLN